jgi:ribosomal protein S18 acetylase RimI-like enzyme
MVRRGAGRLYVDTSTTERYAPVRAFYERMGFAKVADLADFYRPGDGKAVFVKGLTGSGMQADALVDRNGNDRPTSV